MEDWQREDVYFSADVEVDGPVPGPYSMLSFALVLAGTFDGDVYRDLSDQRDSFYRELKPSGPSVDPEMLRHAGLDRDRLLVEGSDPAAACKQAAAWVTGVVDRFGRATPILVGYPAPFDHMFLCWYFEVFSPGHWPFSYNHTLDMKTMYAVKARSTMCASVRPLMPPELVSEAGDARRHDALSDATSQALMFSRMFAWPGRQ